MKFLLIVALLPCALAQCPPEDGTPEEPPKCQGADKLCGGTTMEGDDGCLRTTPFWCMGVNPYEKCSSRQECPIECPFTDQLCPGELDQDGCPTPGTCMPWFEGDCPVYCPVQCGMMEQLCPGGEDANGCKQPDFCIFNDPWNPYGTFCPVVCKENEITCPGAPGTQDSCIPFDPTLPCDPVCPPACNPENEIHCPGPVDPVTNCKSEGLCIQSEPTALCQDKCPIQCPSNEQSCYMGHDDKGCILPETCPIEGVCPEPESPANQK